MLDFFFYVSQRELLAHGFLVLIHLVNSPSCQSHGIGLFVLPVDSMPASSADGPQEPFLVLTYCDCSGAKAYCSWTQDSSNELHLAPCLISSFLISLLISSSQASQCHVHSPGISAFVKGCIHSTPSCPCIPQFIPGRNLPSCIVYASVSSCLHHIPLQQSLDSPEAPARCRWCLVKSRGQLLALPMRPQYDKSSRASPNWDSLAPIRSPSSMPSPARLEISNRLCQSLQYID
ncbi:hypothetical protein B0J15DRAFT_297886 [Fusarium solani]|uniref:Uncharacterized protein n=1 Tax=Fusarium solani TaxID=169388 RepID=A0A9P9HIT6_FUSSL|nr:uncharacterized protein B0J15DRAFT_297886 [Fusarium solani]KAH7258365.1 hypothetical protein B0J15DRAFT_297886 [Fusarium solani]